MLTIALVAQNGRAGKATIALNLAVPRRWSAAPTRSPSAPSPATAISTRWSPTCAARTPSRRIRARGSCRSQAELPSRAARPALAASTMTVGLETCWFASNGSTFVVLHGIRPPFSLEPHATPTCSRELDTSLPKPKGRCRGLCLCIVHLVAISGLTAAAGGPANAWRSEVAGAWGLFLVNPR